MCKSDYINCVLGRDFKHTPYPHACCLGKMLITHKFFHMWQEGDFHQFCSFSSNGSLLLLSGV